MAGTTSIQQLRWALRGRARGAAAVACLVMAASAAWAARADEASWPETPGEIRFEASNLIVTVDGMFQRWRITRVRVDRRDLLAGALELEVDVASLDTGIEWRDDDLRTSDFFDVERFPTAKARVSGVNSAPDGGPNDYTASFELTIHGVTKTVEGRFEVLSTSPPRVKGEVPLKRLDFGVGAPPRFWNPASIRNAVLVSFEVSLPEPS